MAPFAFGPGQAIKYSARPCSENPRPPDEERGPDFLRRELASGLAGHEACFDLMVQLRKGSMPVDDVTVEWSERGVAVPSCRPDRSAAAVDRHAGPRCVLRGVGLQSLECAGSAFTLGVDE